MANMKYGAIRGIDHAVSRIALGTSGMRSYDQAASLLDSFFARGGNCLDTAHVYGNGVCEQVVGEWLRRNGQSIRVMLVGKGAHPPNCCPEAIAGELTVSLDRLGVEHVDLYLLHRDDRQVPVKEWVDALEAEVGAGRIGAYGGSNWHRDRVEQANAHAAESGGRGFVALSNHLSLATMADPLYPGCAAISDEDVGWLVQHELALLPWSSQARGFFSEVDPMLLDPNMRRCWDTPTNRDRRRRAETLARALGVRAINVALAFVLAQPMETFPLIGPRDKDEVEIALMALGVELNEDSMRWLAHGGRPPVAV